MTKKEFIKKVRKTYKKVFQVSISDKGEFWCQGFDTPLFIKKCKCGDKSCEGWQLKGKHPMGDFYDSLVLSQAASYYHAPIIKIKSFSAGPISACGGNGGSL